MNNRLERGIIMKLKTRLITAFFVIACVPLILALLAFAGFSHIQVNALKAKLGITDISYESLANTLRYHVICPADMQIRVRFEAKMDEQEKKEQQKKRNRLKRRYDEKLGNE